MGDIGGMAAVYLDDDDPPSTSSPRAWTGCPTTSLPETGTDVWVVSYFTGADVARDPGAMARWGALARRVVAASA